MPLQLLPMTEADVTKFHLIHWQASQNDFMGISFPNGYTAAANESISASSLQDWRAHPDSVKMLKVIDTDLPDDDAYGKMVSGARYKVFARPRTEEEVLLEVKEREERRTKAPPEGVNSEWLKALGGAMTRGQEELIGNAPHVYLSLLFTLPRHYRRGAGAMLIQWGFDVADELGVPCYVVASPMGRPLYERMGYKFIQPFDIDMKVWSGGREMSYNWLKRDSLAAGGSSS